MSKPTNYRILITTLLVIFLCSVASSNVLHRVSLGSREQSDTILLELDYPVETQVTVLPDQQLAIRFEQTSLSADFVVPVVSSDLQVVRSLATELQASSLLLRVQLGRDAEPSELTLSTQPWKYVVQLIPKSTNGRAPNLEWIPGDRPIRTKYAAGDSGLERTNRAQFSRTTLTALLALAFLAGAAAVAILITLLDWAERRGEASRWPQSASLPLEPDLNRELSQDMDRLKQIAERERNQIAESAAATEARIRLVLQMIREGREVSMIAKALELTPDQVRDILERNS